MKTKLTHLKTTIIACCLLVWVNCSVAQTQNPLWSLPPNKLEISPTLNLNALPTPPGGNGYKGLSSFYDNCASPNLISGPSNMYADANGNPLFFIQIAR